MNEKYTIFCAGSFGREIGSMIESEEIGTVTYTYHTKDELLKHGSKISDDLTKWISEDEYNPVIHGLPVITTGNHELRKKIENNIRSIYPLIVFPTVVSKKAHIGQRVQIGEGTIVTANCIITCDVVVGKFVNLNLSTTVGHDVVLGDYVTTAPGVHINGNVVVGDNTYFGSNSATVENITISENVIIGAGAVVSKNIVEQGTYVGVPAKILRR